SALNSTSLKNHAITIDGLNPNTTYYFQIRSGTSVNVYTYPCKLLTTAPSAKSTLLFGLNKSWKYTTNNLDGLQWQTTAYDDSAWAGPGPGLLYVEDNAAVPFRVTPVPSRNNTNGAPAPSSMSPTYYFRTHFTFDGNATGASLV